MRSRGEGPVVYVGPARSEAIEDAVRRGGGRLGAAAEAEVFVWMGSPVEFEAAVHRGVKWVQLKAAGVDGWLDSGVIDGTRAYTSARGAYGPIVAEHALALLLAGARRLHERARADAWTPAPTESMDAARVLIAGCGGVGEALLRMLVPLGATVTALTRSGRKVEGAAESLPSEALWDALPAADYLVLAAPSTSATRRMIGAPELGQLPSHAWIVNIARGDLIDTDALVQALAGGSIRGAGLDVTDPEPLPVGHPLWSSPRILITPHEANPSAARMRRLARRVEENLTRYVEGRPLLASVDVERGY